MRLTIDQCILSRVWFGFFLAGITEMPFVGGRRINNASLRYGKTATDVMQGQTHVLVKTAT